MLTPTAAPLASPSPTPALPGELWLLDRITGCPRLALPASPRAAGRVSDHKLVLGPSGAGRTVLLARLGLAAYEAGRAVVLIEQTDRGEASALHQLANRLGGPAHRLNFGVGFNPFWIPAQNGPGWQPPTDNVVEELFELLAALFDLETPPATRPPLRLRVLGYLLRRYYESWGQPDAFWSPTRDFWRGRPGSPAQQWHDGPSFNSFYELMMMEAGRSSQPEFETAYTWLLATARKYYAGNPLDHLLNALPEWQAELVGSPNRCLYFHWPHGEPLATWQRSYWLLLYTLDTHLARYDGRVASRRLSVITNGLPDDFTEENQLFHSANYLYSARLFDRELVVGAAQLPAWLLLDNLCTKLLLPGCLDETAAAGELGLTPAAAAQVAQLSPAKREVAVLVGQSLSVYSAWLSPTELAPYQLRPPE
jgi:hypothetical protein